MSWAENTLTAVRAGITALTSQTHPIASYRIGPVEYTYQDLDKLFEWEQKLAQRVGDIGRSRVYLADVGGGPS